MPTLTLARRPALSAAEQYGNPNTELGRRGLWSAGRDLNPRLYGFAGRSLGPLGHRRRDSQRTGDGPSDGAGRPQPSLVRAATAAVTEVAPASRRQATTALSVVPVNTTSSTTTAWRPPTGSPTL